MVNRQGAGLFDNRIGVSLTHPLSRRADGPVKRARRFTHPDLKQGLRQVMAGTDAACSSCLSCNDDMLCHTSSTKRCWVVGGEATCRSFGRRAVRFEANGKVEPLGLVARGSGPPRLLTVFNSSKGGVAMKCGKTVRLRAVRLTVVEVVEMLDALQNAKALTHLDGRQRQHLDDAIVILTRTKDRSTGKYVEIPVEVTAMVMRCISMTQQWFESMLAEFGRVELD
jgi:hypothetical protein